MLSENCRFPAHMFRQNNSGFVDPGGPDPSFDQKEDEFASYRRVRDEIRAFSESLPQSLEE